MIAHFNFSQVITPALAVLGAVLGIINTWHNIDRKRLKLKERRRTPFQSVVWPKN